MNCFPMGNKTLVASVYTNEGRNRAGHSARGKQEGRKLKMKRMSLLVLALLLIAVPTYKYAAQRVRHP